MRIIYSYGIILKLIISNFRGPRSTVPSPLSTILLTVLPTGNPTTDCASHRLPSCLLLISWPVVVLAAESTANLLFPWLIVVCLYCLKNQILLSFSSTTIGFRLFRRFPIVISSLPLLHSFLSKKMNRRLKHKAS